MLKQWLLAGTLTSLIIGVVVLPTVAGTAVSPKLDTIAAMTVHRCAAAPVIDGRLDDTVWKNTPPSQPFAVLSGSGPSEAPTTVKVTFDEKALYIAFNCREPRMDRLQATMTKHDADIWTEDCIEVFLDPDCNQMDYYHFVVNAIGTRFEELCSPGGKNAGWNPDWQAAATRQADGYFVEIAIPWKSINWKAKEGMVLATNFNRARRADTSENQAWSLTTGGFHDPTHFGLLVCKAASDKPPLSVRFDEVAAGKKGYSARATIGNSSQAAAAARIEWYCSLPGRHVRTSRTITVPDKDTVTVDIPLGDVEEAGSASIILTIYDAADHVADASKYAFRVRPTKTQGYGAVVTRAGGIMLWTADAMHKIFRDQPPPTAKAKAVEISAARHEYEPFQLVVHSETGLSNVKVRVSHLRGPKGAFIPSERVKLKLVDYVPVTIPTDSLGYEGLWPDPLPDYKPFSVNAGEGQPVWVTVYVPKGQPAGDYTGAITVTADSETLTVPLRLHVWDFTLTDETHTRTAYGLSSSYINRYQGLSGAASEQAYSRYLDDFARHRVSPYYPMAFHEWHYKYTGPVLVVDNGVLRLTCDQWSGNILSIEREGVQIGDLRPCVTHERDGNQGWSHPERITRIEVLQQTPEVFRAIFYGRHFASGTWLGGYDIAFEITVYAGQDWLLSKPLWMRGTDEEPCDVVNYFQLIGPVLAGDSSDDKAYNAKDYGAWLDGHAALGAASERPNDYKYRLHTDERGGKHGDVMRQIGRKMSRGTTVFKDEPPLIVFANNEGTRQSVDQQVERIRREIAEWLPPRRPAGTKVTVTRIEEPQLTFDFEDFDKSAKKNIEQRHFNGFNFGGIPRTLAGAPRFSPEFDNAFVDIYGRFAQHLEDNGWLDEAYVYWFDEPSEADYPHVIKGMKLLRRAHPRLRRLLTEQPEPELYGHVDIWVPVLGAFNAEDCRARQAAGDEVWWYVCCGPKTPYPNNFIDHPAIEHRVRFWMMEKYGVTGSLYWSTTYWRDNPWENGMSFTPDGKRTWGNGDGKLIYPATRIESNVPVVAGPVDSIRWELIREGLEDREYFWTLRQLVSRLERERLCGADAVLAQAQAALDAPDRLIGSLTRFEKDPAKYFAARAQLARAIEAAQDALRK